LRNPKEKCVPTIYSLLLCSLVERVILALEIGSSKSSMVWIWQHDKRTDDYKIILNCVRKIDEK
jgi:hypothetical protein